MESMDALERERLAEHQSLRRTLLSDAAECMFAALQVQVEACPSCVAQRCSDPTHATIRAIREDLRNDWAARHAPRVGVIAAPRGAHQP